MSPSLEALETHFSGSLMAALNIVFVFFNTVKTSVRMISAEMRLLLMSFYSWSHFQDDVIHGD